jgi:hypothetical protein
VVPGWQLLGNPFFTPLDLASSSVNYNSTTYDMEAAVTAGLISEIAWVYDETILGYRLVSPLSFALRTVGPWRGFWLRGLQNCTLEMQREGIGVGAAASFQPSALDTTTWQVRLEAQMGQYRDQDNYLGVAERALLAPSPPLPGRGVDVSWGSGTGEPLAVALYTHQLPSSEQPLTVSWADSVGPITLSWPEVNVQAPDRALLLTDLATGQVVNLRTTAAYEFTASEAYGEREFLLQILDENPYALTVSQLATSATGQGVQISFHLSAAANCEVEILNIAGRPVRALLSDSLQAAGTNLVTWDGRNQSGARVPPGRYLIKLEARNEQGSLATALGTLTVKR